MISGSAAVRRELEGFELSQIWISDDAIEELADRQFDRMYAFAKTTSIPLHVIAAPDGTIFARYTYSPTGTPDDYLAFLRKGMDAYRAHRAKK